MITLFTSYDNDIHSIVLDYSYAIEEVVYRPS